MPSFSSPIMQWRNFRLTPLEMLIALLAVLGIIYLASTWSRNGDSYPVQNAVVQEPNSPWQQLLTASENSSQQIMLLQKEVASLRTELAEQNQRLNILEQHQGVASRGNASAQLPADRPKYHKVKSGETLSSLAQLYQLSATDLAAWNNLKPSAALKVGQRLRLGPR